jgi:hypothetical protein
MCFSLLRGASYIQGYLGNTDKAFIGAIGISDSLRTCNLYYIQGMNITHETIVPQQVRHGSLSLCHITRSFPR